MSLNLNLTSLPTTPQEALAAVNELPPSVLYSAGAGLVLLAILLSTNLFGSKNPNAPPGPKPAWLVGNTFQVPTRNSWIYFHNLAKQYGPIVNLNMAGQNVVVLDHPDDAEELLTKRAAHYSSRQQLVYAGKYRSHDRRLVLLPYGQLLKKQRAAVYTMVNPRIVGTYERIQETGAMVLLNDLLDAPESAYLSVKRYTAQTLLTLVYGKKFRDDDELRTLLKILESFILDMHPARYLVDTFNVLDKLPEFLAPWKAKARYWHDNELTFYKRLLYEVKARMDAGEEVDCFASRLWEDWDKLALDETSVAYVAGSAFEAGTDNTAGSLLWFIVAALHFPETIKKAQAEIDAVCGADAKVAPSIGHLEQLPYCVSLCKEVFRWMPVAPCCAPHLSEKDDTYKGYFLPKDTLVIPNIWAMHHNETLYPEPFKFNPDRFMPKNGEVLTGSSLNEGHYGFGFGRRVCPGQYLASKSVWIGLVRLMWAFNIVPPTDAAGKPVYPDPAACRHGLTAEPDHYDVIMTPRSEAHVRHIRSMKE